MGKALGFATMPRARVREIARLGGKAAHAKGTAHEFTIAEAAVAGRLGGRASQRKRAQAAALSLAHAELGPEMAVAGVDDEGSAIFSPGITGVE